MDTDYANYNISNFSKFKKDDFLLGELKETVTLKNNVNVFYYNTLINFGDRKTLFTLNFNNVKVFFFTNENYIELKLPFNEYKDLFTAIRHMSNKLIIDYKKLYNEDIKGDIVIEQNRKYTMKIRITGISQIITKTGLKLNVADFYKINKKELLISTLSLQFFIFKNKNGCYFNTRLKKLFLDDALQDENLNTITDIDYNTFKDLNINERKKYYRPKINTFDENIENHCYELIGLYFPQDENVLACTYKDILDHIKKHQKFEVNTYLLPEKQALKKYCPIYKDNENNYHYFLTFLFNNRKTDNRPTEENKIKLLDKAKYYLDRRLIDTLGFWYDQASPPEEYVHFNMHCRSPLPVHYFKVLFDEWEKKNGEVLLDYVFDPLLARLYLARNHRMLNNTSYKYRTKEEIFEEARSTFQYYFYKEKTQEELLTFLKNTFSAEAPVHTKKEQENKIILNNANKVIINNFNNSPNSSSNSDDLNLPLDNYQSIKPSPIDVSSKSTQVEKIEKNPVVSQKTIENDNDNEMSFDKLLSSINKLNKSEAFMVCNILLNKLDEEQKQVLGSMLRIKK
jgi:hypothetical protein